MKKYDGKAVSVTLSEEMKQAGQEYPHLEQVYMKVFGKPLPESKKPTIKGNGREIYYPDSEDSEENEDAERASLFGALSHFN